MADSLFRRPHYWQRLRSNPLGEIIKDYAAHFRELGYSWLTVRAHVQALEHFGHWMGVKHLGPSDVDRDLIRWFLRKHIPCCRCPAPAPCSFGQVRPALNHLLRLFESRGICDSNATARRWPIDKVLEQFQVHLRDVCGLSESTRYSRLRHAREFLEQRFGERKPKWKELRPADVISFVTGIAQRCRPSSVHVAASSLRCFLRYLQLRGWCGTSLLAAVPRVANWRLAHLPKALSEEQLHQFLLVFDRSTANGCRDYAMALCQVVLGLRVSEVVNLRLDDIEWCNGGVRLDDSKGRCERELPLPVRVGQALAQYIQNQRLQPVVAMCYSHACGADRDPYRETGAAVGQKTQQSTAACLELGDSLECSQAI